MAQGNRQRTVSAHRMPADAATRRIHREMGGQQRRQLLDHVAVHVEAPGIRRLRGINIKTRTLAKLPVTGRTLNAGITRAGVGHHQHHAQPCRQTLGAGLDGGGFLGAGKAGQEIQHGATADRGLRWLIKRKPHQSFAGFRWVTVDALHATVQALFGDRFKYGHGALGYAISRPPRIAGHTSLSRSGGTVTCRHGG